MPAFHHGPSHRLRHGTREESLHGIGRHQGRVPLLRLLLFHQPSLHAHEQCGVGWRNQRQGVDGRRHGRNLIVAPTVVGFRRIEVGDPVGGGDGILTETLHHAACSLPPSVLMQCRGHACLAEYGEVGSVSLCMVQKGLPRCLGLRSELGGRE